MRRAGLALLLVAGCVGTNPDWDPPDPATSGIILDTGTSEGRSIEATTGSSSGSGTDASSTDAAGSSEGTSSGASSSGDASESGPIPCGGPMHQLCAGECVNVDRDPNACGVLCIDCTALFGDDAECKHGMCRDH